MIFTNYNYYYYLFWREWNTKQRDFGFHRISDPFFFFLPALIGLPISRLEPGRNRRGSRRCSGVPRRRWCGIPLRVGVRGERSRFGVEFALRINKKASIVFFPLYWVGKGGVSILNSHELIGGCLLGVSGSHIGMMHPHQLPVRWFDLQTGRQRTDAENVVQRWNRRRAFHRWKGTVVVSRVSGGLSLGRGGIGCRDRRRAAGGGDRGNRRCTVDIELWRTTEDAEGGHRRCRCADHGVRLVVIMVCNNLQLVNSSKKKEIELKWEVGSGVRDLY